jgi:hypothetical protein
MPHKRSPLGLQKRVIRGVIFRNAYHDRLACEVVSMLSRHDLLGMLNFNGLNVSLIPEVERGEVLVDSRGGGSFQKALHTHRKA